VTIRVRRRQHRLADADAHEFLAPISLHAQPGCTIDAEQAFVIDALAFSRKQNSESAITESRPLVR
jgi:hypothetical protein